MSPRDEEAGEKRTTGRRHRPLSSRNIPCGLITEPQRVVAETSAEFVPADGGKLNIPEHGVELSIPPGAIPDDGDGEKQEIYLRVCFLHNIFSLKLYSSKYMGLFTKCI